MKTREDGAVLDASAVLAVLNGEPAAADVISTLSKDPLLSAVNYAEVISKLVERGGALGDAADAVRGLGVTIIDFDSALAERVGALRRETRGQGLSLGDRACLALADRREVPAVTCETGWGKSIAGIQIQFVDNRARR